MKKYFTDIIKPKWYVVVIGLLVFTAQCMAMISLCYQFGGGYYLIIPLQLITGYLNVIIFLMFQKDKKRKDSIAIAVAAIALAVAASLLIFSDIYTSVPALKGVFYGVVMQITLSLAFYVSIRLAKDAIDKKIKGAQ